MEPSQSDSFVEDKSNSLNVSCQARSALASIQSFAAERAVHVHQVNPPGARADERFKRREGMRLLAVGACDAPAFYIDGGVELHGICW